MSFMSISMCQRLGVPSVSTMCRADAAYSIRSESRSPPRSARARAAPVCRAPGTAHTPLARSRAGRPPVDPTVSRRVAKLSASGSPTRPRPTTETSCSKESSASLTARKCTAAQTPPRRRGVAQVARRQPHRFWTGEKAFESTPLHHAAPALAVAMKSKAAPRRQHRASRIGRICAIQSPCLVAPIPPTRRLAHRC